MCSKSRNQRNERIESYRQYSIIKNETSSETMIRFLLQKIAQDEAQLEMLEEDLKAAGNFKLRADIREKIKILESRIQLWKNDLQKKRFLLGGRSGQEYGQG